MIRWYVKGKYMKIPMNIYQSDMAVSSHQLSKILEGDDKFEEVYYQTKRNEPTKAMLQGTLVHTLLLEPHLLSKEYEQIGKESGFSLLKLQKIKAMVMDSDSAALLKWKDSLIEESFFTDYLHEDTHMSFRARPDLIILDKTSILVDVKTISGLERAESSITNYNYDFQLAFYKWILERNDIKVDKVCIIWVDHRNMETALQYISHKTLKMGKKLVGHAFDLYSNWLIKQRGN